MKNAAVSDGWPRQLACRGAEGTRGDRAILLRLRRPDRQAVAAAFAAARALRAVVLSGLRDCPAILLKCSAIAVLLLLLQLLGDAPSAAWGLSRYARSENGTAPPGARPLGAQAAASFPGRHLHVNPDIGDDRADGLSPKPSGATGPVKTIARAISLARAGDTIDLASRAAPYKESAVFFNRSGEPGRPITLDGHGATLSGCEPIVPRDWQAAGPGLYRNARLLRTNSAIIGRWFFRFQGAMNHMGRTSKGPRMPLKKPQELRPGEWTFHDADQAFYIQIDPARRLDDYRVEFPLRANGVGIGGHCEHLVIRNLTATHVWNDGYNIHGKTRDILFENIRAVECGDDGLSAHDDCEVRVEGFVSIANSTGVCNVGHSTSSNNRLLIQGTRGVDFYMLGDNLHTLSNSIIFTSGSRTIVVAGEGRAQEPCRLKIDNVVVKRSGEAATMEFARDSVVEAKRWTVDGLGILASGRSLCLRNSILAGGPDAEIVVAPGTRWQAERNLYDLKSLRLGNDRYTAKNADAYRKAVASDQHSIWETVRFRQPFDGRPESPCVQAGVGADAALVPKR